MREKEVVDPSTSKDDNNHMPFKVSGEEPKY